MTVIEEFTASMERMVAEMRENAAQRQIQYADITAKLQKAIDETQKNIENIRIIREAIFGVPLCAWCENDLGKGFRCHNTNEEVCEECYDEHLLADDPCRECRQFEREEALGI